MTDKVQKIRKELARLKEETSIGLSEYDAGFENGRMEILNALSIFLDSMQEEPVSEDDAIEYGKKNVLAELEKIVKDKEEAGKNYVFAFSEVKELVKKMSKKGPTN